MPMHDDEIEDVYLDHENLPARPHHHGELHLSRETREAYHKFYRACAGLLVLSLLLTTIRGWELRRFIADFLAIFFIASAAFKFVHIEAFAVAYRRYDIIASKLRPWAYGLPFIEAFLGFWYLLSSAPQRLNIVALLLVCVANIGAFRAIKKPSHTDQPSLGGVFQLSLLRITVIQDKAMTSLIIILIILTAL